MTVEVAIALDGGSPDASEFRTAIEADPALREVRLTFAAGEEFTEALKHAEVVVTGAAVTNASGLPRLRWVSYWSAGLDGKMPEQLTEQGILVTNASGVHGPNIAEHVLGFMLMFVRNLHLFVRAQVDGEWRREFVSQSIGAGELTGKTLGIIGLGRIGEALTVRARSFGMRIVATKRDTSARYDASVAPDAILPPEQLPRLLEQADFVCVAVPYSPDTHHLINASALAACKRTAYLINIARGKIVHEQALISALQQGRLAGAGLDVFEQEPLPPDSPLWKMQNVIITPHVAGLTPHYYNRVAALFAANLRRYVAGEPLQNAFDSRRGY